MLALLLVLAMLLPMLPMGTLAEETGEVAEEAAAAAANISAQYGIVENEYGDRQVKVVANLETDGHYWLVAAGYGSDGRMLDSNCNIHNFYLDANDYARVTVFALDSRNNLLAYADAEETTFASDSQGRNAPGNPTEETEETLPEATEETLPETTEETLPETTEETVPETTEETVPEITEEPLPETTEEPDRALTEEEAAAGDYYVAPEGAELLEGAEAQALAQVIGTEKGSKTRTATFTGLAPNREYLFLSSTSANFYSAIDPQNLQYIAAARSDHHGDLTVDYLPRTDVKTVVQLYGPEKLTVTPESDYITLRQGQSQTLEFKSNYESAQWYTTLPVEGATDYVSLEYEYRRFQVRLKEGMPTPTEPFSCYFRVVFEERETKQEASAMVRVDYIPEDVKAVGASLGETAVTRNLYDKNPTELPIFLNLERQTAAPEEPVVSEQAALDDAPDNTGMITGVEFAEGTPELVKEFFTVSVKNDHTLLLGTRIDYYKYLDEDPELMRDIQALKSSYPNLRFRLTVDGQEEPILTSNALKLTVQKKLPEPRFNPITLNPYYKPYVNAITPDGESFVFLEFDAGSLPVLGAPDMFRLRSDVTKAASGSVKFKFGLGTHFDNEYNVPITATVPVKIDVTPPALKLGSTSLTVSSVGALDEVIPITCSTKGLEMENLWIRNVTLSGDGAEYYTALYDQGYLRLLSTPTQDLRPAGKHTLTVTLLVGMWSKTIDLKLTINSKDPTVRLSNRAISINTAASADEGGQVSYTLSGLTAPLDLTAEALEENAPLQVHLNETKRDMDKGIQGGQIGILPDAGATGTYTVALKAGEKVLATVKVTLTTAKPSVSLSVVGTITNTDDNTWVKVNTRFQNTSGGLADSKWTVRETAGEKKDVTYLFRISHASDGEYWVLRSRPDTLIPAGTYALTYTADWQDTTIRKTVNFTVKKTSNPLSLSGKLNYLDSSSSLKVSTIVVKYGMKDNGERTLLPDVEIWSTGKNPENKTDYFNVTWKHEELLYLSPNGRDLPAGKYTLKLIYNSINTGTEEDPQPMTVSKDFILSRTAVKQRTSVTSVTVHPLVQDPIEISLWTDRAEPNASFYVEICDAKGNKLGEYPVGMALFGDESITEGGGDLWSLHTLRLWGKGVVPAVDTTYKIKLIPDTRDRNNCTWITVKVLGQKSVERLRKFTLTAKESLDPSYTADSVNLTGTYKGFSGSLYTKTSLFRYNPQTKKYDLPADGDHVIQKASASGGKLTGYVWMTDPQVGEKYRLVVDYYGSSACTERWLVGHSESDIQVAYGKNKFTVQPITLYKADPNNHVELQIGATDKDQVIDRIEIKGSAKNSFTLSGNNKDWVLWYTGSAAKLKTTTLTLQIFLRGNETQKPNATVSLKVNVK